MDNGLGVLFMDFSFSDDKDVRVVVVKEVYEVDLK